jgi:hypothetical protein
MPRLVYKTLIKTCKKHFSRAYLDAGGGRNDTERPVKVREVAKKECEYCNK